MRACLERETEIWKVMSASMVVHKHAYYLLAFNKTGESFSPVQQFILQLCKCHKMLVIQRHVSTHFGVIFRLLLKLWAI
jgi:hypothetical protein